MEKKATVALCRAAELREQVAGCRRQLRRRGPVGPAAGGCGLGQYVDGQAQLEVVAAQPGQLVGGPVGSAEQQPLGVGDLAQHLKVQVVEQFSQLRLGPAAFVGFA